jgi:Fe-S oxidoreductase
MALQDFRPMMERCSNCSGCKFIPFEKIKSLRFGENCPSIGYYNFMTYSARGRFQLSQSLLDGRAEVDDTVTEAIHSCTSCGFCDIGCKITRYNLDVLEHNIEQKAYAVEKGKILKGQKPVMDNLAKENSMIPGTKKTSRANWAKDLKMKDLSKEKAEVAFFAGCKYSYDAKLQKTAQSAVKLLLAAGVDLGYLGAADNCCAGRAHQMGFFKEFDKSAGNNIKAFKSAGVKTVVTPCSDCYYAFKREYAKLGSDVKVLHIVEYIDQLIQKGKIKFKKSVPMTVTYHDPCHLGRLGEEYVPWEGKEKKIYNQIHTWEPKKPRYNGIYGIYDAPRNILNAIPGVKLVEMERIREYSWCCGAGGGCSESNPEFSAWTAGERIAEANETGAEAMVTACPWCKNNFVNAVDEDGNKIEVLDIIDLVQQAM